MPTDPDLPPPPDQAPAPGPSPDDDRPSVPGMLGIASVAVLGVLCCAGPALIAAGVLGGLGAWLLNLWLIGAAVLLALGVVGWRLRHRATAAGPADESPRVHTGRER